IRVPASSTTSIVLSAGSSFSVNHTCSSVGTAAAIITPPTAGLARLTRACAETSTGRAESAAISMSIVARGCLPLTCRISLFLKIALTLRRPRPDRKEAPDALRVPKLDLAHSGNEDEEHCRLGRISAARRDPKRRHFGEEA